MGSATYEALGLLEEGSDFTIAEVGKRLASRFPGWVVRTDKNQIGLSSAGWLITLAINEEPSVVDESREIAEALADSPEAAAVARCSRRVEVISDSPDPDMEHFNDYLIVVEVLQSFKGVVVVDLREPSVM